MFLYALNLNSFILLFLYESMFSKVYKVVSNINDELFDIQFQDFMIFLFVNNKFFFLFWD